MYIYLHVHITCLVCNIFSQFLFICQFSYNGWGAREGWWQVNRNSIYYFHAWVCIVYVYYHDYIDIYTKTVFIYKIRKMIVLFIGDVLKLTWLKGRCYRKIMLQTSFKRYLCLWVLSYEHFLTNLIIQLI